MVKVIHYRICMGEESVNVIADSVVHSTTPEDLVQYDRFYAPLHLCLTHGCTRTE